MSHNQGGAWMLTVYITTPGTKIFKEGGVLKVKKDGDTYHTIFPFRTEQVVAFGGVEISASAMNVLLRHGIHTVFLHKNGHYNGKLVCPYDHNVLLRRMQYKMLDDHDKCLEFCRSIARSKLRNQFVMMQRISRFQKRNLKREILQMKEIISKLDSAGEIASLRGFEGAGARVYFSVFGQGFTEPQGFTKRVRRPPTDPVNAVLSFLYTVLFNRVAGAVEREGLDPYVGVFHAIGYGAQALALDLMEEFRTIIVDTLVFSLFNLKIISKNDFRTLSENETEYEDILPSEQAQIPDVIKDRMGAFSRGSEDLFQEYEIADNDDTSLGDDGHGHGSVRGYPVLLTQPALKKVIEQFERKLETTFTCPFENTRITYRKAITNQVRRYIDFLRSESPNYQGLVMR